MKVLRIVRAILREIFDESAYERFCAQKELAPGQESYARFLRRASAARTKVKCC